ncbi:hypothetical protein Taro_056891 [Colocasia esculenta]|uniref:Uncharacterized protein n=1 Tax=Colocasia esculenta TaxID=4460 RepID=A0A843XXV5_COLES|nr:hypothetical protein [Colocasia esculenta]
MEADRKRKRPTEDWEDKRTNSRGDAGNLRSAGTEEAARPPVDGDVEEEVEEFFAIVRRMHAIRRQFTGGDDPMTEASGRQMLRRGQAERKGIYRWRPAFEWEDFEEQHNDKFSDAGDCCTRGEVGSATSASLAAVGVGGKREEKTVPKETSVCLDLNKEPEPELVVGSAPLRMLYPLWWYDPVWAGAKRASTRKKGKTIAGEDEDLQNQKRISGAR